MPTEQTQKYENKTACAIFCRCFRLISPNEKVTSEFQGHRATKTFPPRENISGATVNDISFWPLSFQQTKFQRLHATLPSYTMLKIISCLLFIAHFLLEKVRRSPSSPIWPSHGEPIQSNYSANGKRHLCASSLNEFRGPHSLTLSLSLSGPTITAIISGNTGWQRHLHNGNCQLIK